ncbi:MAG: hypothetical protein KKF62_17330 [Bacteroidetes bacterium]|nr:hypothetical protein [Bacteroidota bacterium]MBU1115392.1 hypothetical protein [Bacteroidota bacterium]MBU1797913.1 hypothetical protein [Bacteroidota bacterium]
MRKLNKNHIIILLISTIICILLSGFIDYENSVYSNMDMNKYIAMAEVSPGINTNIIKPFVYRIGAPWIAGLLPFTIPINFLILNSISLFFLSLVFFLFLLEYKTDTSLALVFTIIFQLNRYLFQFLGWNYFQLSDTLSLVFLFYSLILLRHRKYLALLFVVIVGIFIKEYMLMLIPAGFVLLYESGFKRKELFYFSIISLILISIFIGLRQIITAEVGGESLFSQYLTQVAYYSNPIFLLKRFVGAFTPFGLLPFIFYKELFMFFKENKHLFVFVMTVIILSFFGESERLMAPLYPIYFLFIANLISKYFSFNFQNIFKSKKVIALILISFLTSFYHLWGIIRLPNKYYSLISAVIFSLIVSIIFIMERIRNVNAKRID